MIRGDTPHFEYVAGEAAAGFQAVALATGIPIVFGVLTVDTLHRRSTGSAAPRGTRARKRRTPRSR